MTRSVRAGKLPGSPSLLGLAAGTLGLAIPAASAANTAGWLRLAHCRPNTRRWTSTSTRSRSLGPDRAQARQLRHRVRVQRVPTGEYTVGCACRVPRPRPGRCCRPPSTWPPADAYTVAGMGPGVRPPAAGVQGPAEDAARQALVADIPGIDAPERGHRAGGHDGTRPEAQVHHRDAVPGRVRPADLTGTRSERVRAGVGRVHAGGQRDLTPSWSWMTNGHLKVACLMDSAGSKVMPTAAPRGVRRHRTGARRAAVAVAGRCAAGNARHGRGGAAAARRRRRPALHADELKNRPRPAHLPRPGGAPAVAAIVLAAGLLGGGTGVAGLALAARTGIRPPLPPGARRCCGARPAPRRPAPQPSLARWPGRPGWSSRPSAVPYQLYPARPHAVRRPPGPPGAPRVAGWYTGSSRPARVGAAVIGGPYRLPSRPRRLLPAAPAAPGQPVYVWRADGTLAAFRVTAVRTYLKSRFPTEAVYGPPAPGRAATADHLRRHVRLRPHRSLPEQTGDSSTAARCHWPPRAGQPAPYWARRTGDLRKGWCHALAGRRSDRSRTVNHAHLRGRPWAGLSRSLRDRGGPGRPGSVAAVGQAADALTARNRRTSRSSTPLRNGVIADLDASAAMLRPSCEGPGCAAACCGPRPWCACLAVPPGGTAVPGRRGRGRCGPGCAVRLDRRAGRRRAAPALTSPRVRCLRRGHRRRDHRDRGAGRRSRGPRPVAAHRRQRDDEAIVHAVKAELGLLIGRNAAREPENRARLAESEAGSVEAVGVDAARPDRRGGARAGRLPSPAALEDCVTAIVDAVAGNAGQNIPPEPRRRGGARKDQAGRRRGAAPRPGQQDRGGAGIPAVVVDDPLRCVVRGAAEILSTARSSPPRRLQRPRRPGGNSRAAPARAATGPPARAGC